MFSTVATSLDCRRPAFWLKRAVTKPTVLPAGHDLAVDHLVGATRNKAWISATAVFDTEALASGGGGAACHGARLVLLPTVFDAMLRSITWTAGAAIKLACSTSTMLDADATCMHK